MEDVFMQAPMFTALDAEAATALRACLTEQSLTKGGILLPKASRVIACM